MWFGPSERETLRPREKRVVLLKPGLARVCLSLRILSHVWPFIAQRHGSYTVTLGPTGGPGITWLTT
jgi:hypothetical protein